MKKLLYVVLAILLLSMVLSIGICADVGNAFDDNDYGWGGGGGGGDSDFDLGALIYIGALLSDNPPLAFLALVVIVLLIIFRKKLGIGRSGSRGAPFFGPGGFPNVQNPQPVMDEAAVVAAVSAVDPDFSSEQFKSYASDVYLRVQEAWEKRDWRVVRPFESDKLFSMHERQLQEFIDSKKTNHLDGQNVKSVTLTGFKTEGVNEVLTVRLHASLLDFTTDDATGKVLAGSKTERRDRMYRLEFIRAAGVKTENTKGFKSGECPSCGAPVEVTHTGICEYCRNIITNGQYGWVLNEYTKW